MRLWHCEIVASRIRFFKISWLGYEQYEKNQYKRNGQNQQFIVQSVMMTFTLFNCQRSIDNSIDFDLYFYSEKDHDNKEFSREN